MAGVEADRDYDEDVMKNNEGGSLIKQMTYDSRENRFFQEHSLKFIEMALSTERIEKVANPDGYGKRTGDCGDTVEFFLKCSNGRIDMVSFIVQGCLHTIACCNTVSKFVEGLSVKTAWEIDPEKVIDFLETLPEDHYHCAELAVGALYRALADIGTA